MLPRVEVQFIIGHIRLNRDSAKQENVVDSTWFFVPHYYSVLHEHTEDSLCK